MRSDYLPPKKLLEAEFLLCEREGLAEADPKWATSKAKAYKSNAVQTKLFAQHFRVLSSLEMGKLGELLDAELVDRDN